MRSGKIEEAALWCHVLMSAWILTVAFFALFVIAGCDFQKSRVSEEAESPAVQVRVLAFVAPWCKSCKRAKPWLLSIRADGVDVRIVDIDRNSDLARRYGVKSVPTFFVYVGNRQPVRTEHIWVVILLAGGL